jgi:hypothetical protein
MEGSILRRAPNYILPHPINSLPTNVISALVRDMIVMIVATQVVVEVTVVGVVAEEAAEEGMRVLANLLTLAGRDDDPRIMGEGRDRLRRQVLVDGNLGLNFGHNELILVLTYFSLPDL